MTRRIGFLGFDAVQALDLVGPAAFVEDARMAEAGRRLSSRGVNIDTVARSVGYTSEDVFRRTFQRRVGVSPRNYRSRFRGGNTPFARSSKDK
jgi:AraC-like DNA-binding protein